MACVEFEKLIPEYLEKQLPIERQSRVAAHLAQCAPCREFARQWEQLDAELARSLKAPALPLDFRARLRQRIQTVPAWSEAECVKRRQQLQAEYEAGLARLRIFPLRFPSIRRMRQALVNAAGLAFVGGLGWFLIPALHSVMARLMLTGLDQNHIVTWAAAVIFMLLGWAAAFPCRIRRTLLSRIASEF